MKTDRVRSLLAGKNALWCGKRGGVLFFGRTLLELPMAVLGRAGLLIRACASWGRRGQARRLDRGARGPQRQFYEFPSAYRASQRRAHARISTTAHCDAGIGREALQDVPTSLARSTRRRFRQAPRQLSRRCRTINAVLDAGRPAAGALHLTDARSRSRGVLKSLTDPAARSLRHRAGFGAERIAGALMAP